MTAPAPPARSPTAAVAANRWLPLPPAASVAASGGSEGLRRGGGGGADLNVEGSTAERNTTRIPPPRAPNTTQMPSPRAPPPPLPPPTVEAAAAAARAAATSAGASTASVLSPHRAPFFQHNAEPTPRSPRGSAPSPRQSPRGAGGAPSPRGARVSPWAVAAAGGGGGGDIGGGAASFRPRVAASPRDAPSTSENPSNGDSYSARESASWAGAFGRQWTVGSTGGVGPGIGSSWSHHSAVMPRRDSEAQRAAAAAAAERNPPSARYAQAAQCPPPQRSALSATSPWRPGSQRPEDEVESGAGGEERGSGRGLSGDWPGQSESRATLSAVVVPLFGSPESTRAVAAAAASAAATAAAEAAAAAAPHRGAQAVKFGGESAAMTSP